MPKSETSVSANLLKQNALFLFRSAQSEAATELLLEALRQSPQEASTAITEIVEANTSSPVIRALLTAALGFSPSIPRLQECAGRMAISDGYFDKAIEHFFNAQRLSPSNPEYALALGLSLKYRNRPLEALPHLKKAHFMEPSTATARALADTEFEANHPDLALPLFTDLLTLTPPDTSLRLSLAEAHSQLGNNKQAREVIANGLMLTPSDPALHMALAQALEDDGDDSAAEQAYLSALRLRPAWPTALAGLIGLKRGKCSKELINEGLASLHSPATQPAGRALLGYVLGKAFDSSGRYQDAMLAWDLANQSREALAGQFDAGTLDRHLAALKSAYTSPSDIPSTPSATPQLVFIVGMPRSGTTLTETILAAHPSVHGCGELPDLPRLTLELGPEWPSRIKELDLEQLESMKADYLRSARRHASNGKLVLVDKAPLNFFQLGLVQALFPNARVIWCRRDRRDVALSIYGENFSPTSTFATSFAGISAYQDAEDQLLQFWQATLTLPILVQHYETLATEPRKSTKKLLKFIGLEWNSNTERAHEVAGNVQTPSRWQVREPVHTRSIGRWRNYPKYFSSQTDHPIVTPE